MKTTAVALIVAAFALSLAVYPLLPESMPVHWNLHGSADGFEPKVFGAFTMPVMMIVLALVFALLPRISPRGYEIDARSRAFRAITLSSVGLMLAIHAVVLLSAAGMNIAIPRALPVLLGALFAIVGNYLGKLGRNFFIGIRTPWTLADDDVWFRTHRFGGKLFVVAGIISMFGCLPAADRGLAFVIGVVIAAALVSIVYSYVIYRQLHRVQS